MRLRIKRQNHGGSSGNSRYAANIRFAAMLAEEKIFSGKSIMGFGSGGRNSIEHLY